MRTRPGVVSSQADFRRSQLRRLATLYGVQTAFYDVNHGRRSASPESLVAVLRLLGAPVATLQDVPSALRERQQEVWRRPLEPVLVAWDGVLADVPLRLPAAKADGLRVAGRITLESGEPWPDYQWRGADLPVLERAEVERAQYVAKGLRLPHTLPWGYHRLTVEIPGFMPLDSLVIAAPTRAYTAAEDGGPSDQTGAAWGVFLPLYALYTQKSWGSGDFSDLAALVQWAGGLGGSVVGTLPILSAFLDEPFEPSPYAPASRLLWNEFYLNVSHTPELEQCPEAQALLSSGSFREEIDHLRGLPLVDYRRGMALKRRVLEKLAQCCFSGAPDRREALNRFAAEHPVVEEYARFRATGEKRGQPWTSWPHPLRDGALQEGDYDEPARRYHLYVQWLAHQQVADLSRQARQQGAHLYLDLPLGVHPHGYDVWSRQDSFVTDATVGAPPDAYFTHGQDWGFSPLHPERMREGGHSYFIAYLRHHLQAASLLRIDHVMGLHRLYWVPPGMGPGQGAYVRYPTEELYAILTLESHRNRAAIVGEDLGTVPPEVRPAMRRHGLYRTYVVYFSLADNPRRALSPVPGNALAAINTHDMPPFAAFWQGLDIIERRELGHQSREGASKEQSEREKVKKALASYLQRRALPLARKEKEGPESYEEVEAVLKGILLWLGQSPAPIVLVNLEDLWLEVQSQNVPGTGPERPNWRRKARYSLEEFSHRPRVVELLQTLNELRKQSQASKVKE